MTSEASSSVNLLDTASVGASMAASSPSGCSVISDVDRASPFLPASALNSSPSSPSPYLRQIDFGASTSRSSLDSTRGGDFGEQLAQNAGVQYRRRRRTNSSDSSGSDDGSVGGASHVSSIGGLSRSQDNDDDPEGSRKTSMETPIRQADMPRGRLANIRRESSCTPSDEMAHERLTTAGIQVSSGWDDALRIGGGEEEEAAAAATAAPAASSSAAASPAAAAAAGTAAAVPGSRDEELVMRRRAPSASASSSSTSTANLSELSIFTQTWIPHSCSPSPTRMSESTKQCYSPSTQKIVRPNIPYSPSPSPTASPTRKRLMTARSQSPIASRSALKRRVDGLPSSPVSMSGGGGAGSPMMSSMMMGAMEGRMGGGLGMQMVQGTSNGSSASSSSSFSSSSTSTASSTQPPPEKRSCPAGAMGGGFVRNSTSPLVTMDARTQAAALAIRRHSLFLVDPEIRRASTESYSEIDPAVGGANGDTRDSGDSISEPSSVLMPVGDDPFDPDALLFRAPSVPPPLSVGSNCSSKYETAATDADDTKSTIDGEEEKMDEEDPNMSSSSSSSLLLDSVKKMDDDGTPPECGEADDVSLKEEETPPAAMEE